MNRWLISDLHLAHAKLVLCGDRPLGYESLVAENWRRLVVPDDLVYVLGDVTFGRASALLTWLEALPGHKILVRGNHDHERQAWYLRRGFTFVADAIEHKDVLLTHVPRVPVPEHIRLNVHGHHHAPGTDHEAYRREPSEPYYSHHASRYRCVYLEGTYAPQPWEEVCA